MTQSAYPHLWQMFGAYFHQDWGMEGQDWPDLVRNYQADEPTQDFQLVAGEIDRLVADFPSDSELQSFLWRALGCYYMPRPDLGGPTVREWLKEVAQLLRHNAPPKV